MGAIKCHPPFTSEPASQLNFVRKKACCNANKNKESRKVLAAKLFSFSVFPFLKQISAFACGGSEIIRPIFHFDKLQAIIKLK